MRRSICAALPMIAQFSSLRSRAPRECSSGPPVVRAQSTASNPRGRLWPDGRT
jgi:hypothetical protein